MEVRRPANGQVIGAAEISFSVVKPATSRESAYRIYISIEDDLRSKSEEALTISSYSFSARQTGVTRHADIFYEHKGNYCVDRMRVKGDVIVTLCERDKMLRFYSSDDLRLIASKEIDYEGYWSELGTRGFNIVANGNAYSIFFTAFQTGSSKICSSTASPTTVINNVSTLGH